MRKIADEIVEKIVPLYKSGITQDEVAERLGISPATVSRVIKRSGYDRCHVAGVVSKGIEITPIIPDECKAIEREPDAEPLIVTARTLCLHGPATGCDYVAGTHSDNVDITLGDWMMSVPRAKLGAFVTELEHVRKMIGA